MVVKAEHERKLSTAGAGDGGCDGEQGDDDDAPPRDSRGDDDGGEHWECPGRTEAELAQAAVG